MSKLSDSISCYDDSFYRNQLQDSFASAQRFADLYFQLFHCSSLVDVGCGRGAWLKAFKDRGHVDHVVGIDGHWNNGKLIDPSFRFINCDLNAFSLTNCNLHNQKFDLAISVEVAEHLHPSTSSHFIRQLTELSDAVLFSAGFLGQDGIGHINLRKHSDWAKEFALNGFVPLDIFRPQVYGDPRVKWWYQSNVFLYVPASSDRKPNLISNLDWMDCVHPCLYECSQSTYFLKSLKQSVSLFIPALSRKLGF